MNYPMLGHPHYHFDHLASTNDEAKRLAAGGAPEGTLVTADFQSHGRGRNDRNWDSEPGMNFLGSYLLYPEAPPSEWGALSLLAGIAVRDAVEGLVPCGAAVKWPNDVIAGERKIAGVLIETTILPGRSSAVVGIGLNVNQIRFDGSFRLPPTSLAIESGHAWNRDQAAETLSASLARWYAAWREQGNPHIAEEWKNRSRLAGARIALGVGGELYRGMFVDVNPDGSIRLMLENGEVRDFHAGEIIVVGKGADGKE